MLLDAQQITRRHGARSVLDAVDLRVLAGTRIGLVGPNGAGKSTLLRILAGCEAPDCGIVRRFATVGYLPQFADGQDAHRTVRQVILDRVGLTSASCALDRWASALAAGDLGAVEPHAAALERWLTLGGADIDGRLSAAVSKLGLERGFLDRPLGALSGGQAARAGLAALEVARFYVSLLDEPSNHLDADGLRRLATLLRERHGGIVLVSHDRGLLADSVSEIVELDRRTGQATHYRGGWDAFERERSAARERALAEREYARHRRDQLVAAERETRRRAAASRNRARARVHDNDKNSRAWVTMRAEEMAGRARKMGGRAQRIEIPEVPFENPALRLRLSSGERRQRWVLSLEGAVLRRGRFSLGPLDFSVAYGERVVVSGPNGSGKSTLLGALAGHIDSVRGQRRVAPGAIIAELGRDRDMLTAEAPVSDQVRKLTGLDESTARTALASFGLGSDLAERSAETLSPGERTRAELTILAHRRASCLLLDEPTNHLDTESLEVLEAALAKWSGAVVVASHDRRLRRNLQINRVVAL